MTFEPLPTVENGYRLIYADPCWRFETFTKHEDYDGFEDTKLPDKHYATLTFEELKALPVGDVAADDAWCFLWITAPMLMRAPEILEAWGFKYSSVGFVWCKVKPRMWTAKLIMHVRQIGKLFTFGQGYTTRKNAEYCIIGRRGQPKRLDASIPDLLFAPLREHSRKPDEVYGLIERFCDGPYLELFSRTTSEGWDVWGNETDKFKSE